MNSPDHPPTPRHASLTRAPRTSHPTAAGRRAQAARPTRMPAIPPTVWSASTTHPSAPRDLWPVGVISQIVTSFSQRGDHVLIITADTTTTERIDSVETATRTGAGAGAVEAAFDAVTTAGRVAGITVLWNRPLSHESPAPAYWASLVAGPDHPAAAGERPQSDPIVEDDSVQPRADLIIAAVPPSWTRHRRIDHLALQAARLLRTGGILAVLTHSDVREWQLVDPTGPVVTAGQNADLLYLQHIVALHHTTDEPSDSEVVGTAASDVDRPQPHRRVHSDVLVFAQPHDHEPPPTSAVTATVPSQVIR
ncbi:hypothetical protein [Actinoalloteichus fjordicus]|uniref:Uncharacterized protein n=1 Tax=Actinoalloteichus fjordicus TaxID=1612552 RepID=A0AAC9LCW2_9PSEU|nr:hypothetical protein [Actinoalloteichus fjordicus]APU15301.1 hypothetical protein UA74_16265 [Actinoalloteichus fjordicus]